MFFSDISGEEGGIAVTVDTVFVGGDIDVDDIAVLQQFANFYLGGTGDLIIVLALAGVLLVRPSGLMGRKLA